MINRIPENYSRLPELSLKVFRRNINEVIIKHLNTPIYKSLLAVYDQIVTILQDSIHFSYLCLSRRVDENYYLCYSSIANNTLFYLEGTRVLMLAGFYSESLILLRSIINWINLIRILSGDDKALSDWINETKQYRDGELRAAIKEKGLKDYEKDYKILSIIVHPNIESINLRSSISEPGNPPKLIIKHVPEFDTISLEIISMMIDLSLTLIKEAFMIRSVNDDNLVKEKNILLHQLESNKDDIYNILAINNRIKEYIHEWESRKITFQEFEKKISSIDGIMLEEKELPEK